MPISALALWGAGQAFQPGHAILSDNIIDIISRRADTCPFCQDRFDLDTVPFLAVAVKARNDFPPLEAAAPRMKSTCPPTPL